MRRNFIDQHRLDAAIALQLSLTPAELKPYRPILARLARRHLPLLTIGIRAQPGADDPAWAHRAFANGKVLFRLGEAGALTARSIIARFSLDVERLLLIAKDDGHPHLVSNRLV